MPEEACPLDPPFLKALRSHYFRRTKDLAADLKVLGIEKTPVHLGNILKEKAVPGQTLSAAMRSLALSIIVEDPEILDRPEPVRITRNMRREMEETKEAFRQRVAEFVASRRSTRFEQLGIPPWVLQGSGPVLDEHTEFLLRGLVLDLDAAAAQARAPVLMDSLSDEVRQSLYITLAQILRGFLATPHGVQRALMDAGGANTSPRRLMTPPDTDIV